MHKLILTHSFTNRTHSFEFEDPGFDYFLNDLCFFQVHKLNNNIFFKKSIKLTYRLVCVTDSEVKEKADMKLDTRSSVANRSEHTNLCFSFDFMNLSI